VFRTIFAHPDADTVAGTWDEVRHQLAKSLPKIGPLMDEAKTEVTRPQRVPTGALVEDPVHEPARAGQPGD